MSTNIRLSTHNVTMPLSRDSVRHKVVVLQGHHAGRSFCIDEPTTIGRSAEATIQLDGPRVSRVHIQLVPIGGALLVEDCNSRNGTFVSGEPLHGSRRLHVGDRISLADDVVLLVSRYDVQEEQMRRRQRLETLGRVASGVAHDLNNTVCAALGTLDYLNGVAPTTALGDPDVASCTADLRSALERAADLLPRLLDLSRSSQQAHKSVSVSQLCKEVTLLLSRSFAPTVAVECHATEDVSVIGDAAELYQVLMNLCVNAKDAMADGGTLKVFAEATDDRATLRVTDTGSGMSEAVRARVFEPLFTTKGTDGLGLGLATVKEIVGMHHGEIDVKSVLGQGTTFTISLPRASTPARLELEPVECAPERKRAHVLVVDDEPLLQRSMQRVLRAAGFDVTIAENGSTAVTLYDPLVHDLVILDEELPDMSGTEVHRALFAMSARAQILRVSGRGGSSWESQVMAEGAAGQLAKPWSSRELIASVHRAVSSSQAKRAPLDTHVDPEEILEAQAS